MQDDERSAKAKAPAKAVITVELMPVHASGSPSPAPPPGLPPKHLADWDELWSSGLGSEIAATDMAPLRRLFTLRARWDELLELAFAGDAPSPPGDEGDMLPPPPPGMAYGSMGQLVEHPALKAALSMEKALESLEDRFALSLKARQNAGIRMGKVAVAAKQVAEAAAQEQTSRADPRLANPDAAAAQPRGAGGDVDGGDARPR